MTILPFLAVAFGAGALSLLTRRSALVSGLVGLGGLVLAAVAAAGIGADDTLAVGGRELVGSAYLRLFVLLGSIVALALAVLGFVTTTHRHAPGVLLGSIGAAGLALALPDARIAVLAATAGGLIGILVTVLRPPTARSVVVASREFRAIAVAGVLAILATAWIGRSLGTLAAEPAVFGMAYLGFAAAVAIRFGAIPFHFWAARLADAAPEVTLPMLMAWSPAAFAVVALAWADQSVAPLALPLVAERGLIIAVGAVSIVLGAVAAWVQDDLEHVVGYLIIADAGVAILGLAALQPDAWEPARTWVLSFVVVRSAFAAWAVAVRAAFDTRRIPDLRGWAIRAPGLALAFAVIAVAAIAWPGLASWNARATLIELTLDGPFVLLVTLGTLAPIAVYGRLAVLGLGRPAERMGEGFVERPALPTGALGSAATGGRDAVRSVATTVVAAGRLNRVFVASLLVGALALLAFTVSAGGLGVVDAARAVPQQVPGPTDEPASPAPTEVPSDRPEPSAIPSPSVSVEVSPSVDASVAPPSFQPLPSASP